jgi:ABC-type multidrug transport system fused ATPase/permease subunit
MATAVQSAPGNTPTQIASAKTADDKGLSTWGMLLAAIGGGIGVLGFVAFFGAAILWVRLDQAGLPANEAVALIPRSVLLATGAKFLVPSLLLALAFTALLFLIEAWTISYSTSSLQEAEAALKEKREIAQARHREATAATKKAEERLSAALRAQKAVDELAATETLDAAVLEKSKQSSEAAAASAAEICQRTMADAQEAERELLHWEREYEEQRLAVCDDVEKRRKYLRRVLIILLFGLAALITFIVFSIELGYGRIAILALILGAMITICVTVLERYGFAWFALVSFLAIGILSGFLTYYRTVGDPKVEPAAVLRTGGAPIVGFFVAQTSDRVYLGTSLGNEMVRLNAIDRTEVSDLVVADLTPVAGAETRARRLALKSCLLARERAPQTTANSSSEAAQAVEPCTKADLKRLRAELG